MAVWQIKSLSSDRLYNDNIYISAGRRAVETENAPAWQKGIT